MGITAAGLVPWVAMSASQRWPVVTTACSWRRMAAAMTAWAWVAVSRLVSRVVRCWNRAAKTGLAR
jgi:hypothetical protein